jgi:hypothetical protein
MSGRSILVVMLALAAGAAAAQAAEAPLRVVAKFGVPNTIYTAPCIDAKSIDARFKDSSSVTIDAGRATLRFTPTDEDAAEIAITLTAGAPGANPGDPCASAFQQQLTVAVEKLPMVPAGALESAFRILTAALVLAVLLESAFALLFNWRLFQEYFVGRAWRSPIMFLTSLAVVRQFDLDLVASLFNAYHGVAADVSGGLFTKMLTAMILSGGSVGVNRILVNLNLRTDVPKAVEEQPKVARNEAYISIEVQAGGSQGSRAGRGGQQFEVDLDPVDVGILPATVGTIPCGSKRLRRLLFPNRCRFPASGGFRVGTDKAYRISIVDTGTKTAYNMNGTAVDPKEGPAAYRFASGAIVDFVVKIDELP